jgi:hypothetical protein
MVLSRWMAILCALFVLSAVTPGAEAAEVNERIKHRVGTLPDGAFQLAHCCHSHPRPPYDRYCCHTGAAYVATGVATYHAYKSVKRHSKRVANRRPRRVSRRRR